MKIYREKREERRGTAFSAVSKVTESAPLLD